MSLLFIVWQYRAGVIVMPAHFYYWICVYKVRISCLWAFVTIPFLNFQFTCICLGVEICWIALKCTLWRFSEHPNATDIMIQNIGIVLWPWAFRLVPSKSCLLSFLNHSTFSTFESFCSLVSLHFYSTLHLLSVKSVVIYIVLVLLTGLVTVYTCSETRSNCFTHTHTLTHTHIHTHHCNFNTWGIFCHDRVNQTYSIRQKKLPYFWKHHCCNAKTIL